jgi:RNA polymerase sigma-70 factor, ECF subfamily
MSSAVPSRVPTHDPAAHERELIVRSATGDGEAFDQLVRIYLPRAYALANRILGHREDAEDAVQESFVAAHAAINSVDPDRPFGPWLFRIVANRAINARRSRAVRRADSISDDAPATDRSDLLAERNEIADRFGTALAGLSPRQRAIVQLFEVEGYETSEIAGMLDMAPSTVRWHLHEARERLREALISLAPDRSA